jgi:Fur family iron response transcriptional regulator
MTRTYSQALERLKQVGLRPTRQRLALAKLLLENGDRHITAEELFHEARASGIHVSLATVYNTLHQFTGAGLLREVVVDMGQAISTPTSRIITISSTRPRAGSPTSRPTRSRSAACRPRPKVR